ncbi:MAG: hypothetical protein ISQ08_12960 [Planctomycetes bacterium]|jgi:hypothetical protein|nr:hypothetical protein [Planctomycetota bacterium]
MRAVLLTLASLLAPLTSPSEVLAPEPTMDRNTSPEAAEEPIDVSIDWLTSLDYRRGMRLPDEILALDGQEVRISGYMAIGTLEGADVFELVPESCECGRSKVQHFIEVTLSEDRVRFMPGRIELTGKFSVGEVEEDGFVVSLYRLEVKALP